LRGAFAVLGLNIGPHATIDHAPIFAPPLGQSLSDTYGHLCGKSVGTGPVFSSAPSAANPNYSQSRSAPSVERRPDRGRRNFWNDRIDWDEPRLVFLNKSKDPPSANRKFLDKIRVRSDRAVAKTITGQRRPVASTLVDGVSDPLRCWELAMVWRAPVGASTLQEPSCWVRDLSSDREGLGPTRERGAIYCQF
jgi:hypothetical protein